MVRVSTVKHYGLTRRDFLKLMSAAGAGLAFAPFVPWGNFMPNPQSSPLTERVPVELPGGTQANIGTFPTNHAEVITYPKTGDRVLDEEAFRKWQFIRLPEEMGGSAPDTSAFRIYSMVCLHLWCLWGYDPSDDKKIGHCPCHASTYDMRTGRAIMGPAAVQAAPSNVLPQLNFEADAEGFLWILPPVWEVTGNGVIGYGRLVE